MMKIWQEIPNLALILNLWLNSNKWLKNLDLSNNTKQDHHFLSHLQGLEVL